MDKGLTAGLTGVQGHLNTADAFSVRCAKLLLNQTEIKKFIDIVNNPECLVWIQNPDLEK